MEKEIIEGNKLIAGFMGIKKDNFGDFYNFKSKRSIQSYLPLKMKYHTSWDWLMLIVEKINNTRLGEQHFDVIIYKGDCHINNSFEIIFEQSVMKQGETLIGCVWKSVVSFIQWYNTSNPSQTTPERGD